MFRRNTTIVVGAGASCEIGLPSGDQLRKRILDLFEPADDNAYGLRSPSMIEAAMDRVGHRNQVFLGAVPDHGGEIAAMRGAAARIRRGLPLALSIDNFLHAHQADEEVVRLGKTAIAIAILSAEAESAFYDRHSPVETMRRRRAGGTRRLTLTSEKMLGSWYAPFVRQLLSGIERHSAADAFRGLRFVIFNYDRCVEHYLWLALQDYFDLDADAATEILSTVEFLHPYGSLGSLPWQGGDENAAVPLGGGDGYDVWRIGAGLRTFTESVESGAAAGIKSAVAKASTILLLGFGYLDQNVQLLRPGEGRNASRVISTAYGMSAADQQVVSSIMAQLARDMGAELMLEPGTCRALFDNFRLQLSLQ